MKFVSIAEKWSNVIEDKLYHDERLRLECLAQSIAKNAVRSVNPDQIIAEAKQFEDYVSARRDK